MQNEQIVITRNHIGLGGAITAAGGLLFGILLLVVFGELRQESLIAFGIGVFGFIIWALMTPDDVRNFFGGRQVRYSVFSMFSTILLVGIVVMVYIFLQRAVITLDMTEGQRFTLSQPTHEVLQGVMRASRDIRIIGFYSREDLRLREVDDQYFRQYEVASEGRISRQYIDPDEQPTIAQNFIQRQGTISDGNNVFLAYVNPDGSIDLDSIMRVARSGRQERDVTEAISRLLLAGEFTVYFEVSHGEYDPTDNSGQGMSLVNNGVRASGLITDALDLQSIAASGGQIPADASAVIFARPISRLSNAEITVVDEYLQRGGAIFIMADMVFNENGFLRSGDPFNQYLWDNYGIRTIDAVIVDPVASSQTPLDVMSFAVSSSTPIGQRIAQENQPETLTLFRVARGIDVSSTPPVNNGWVVMSSDQSFGETNLQTLSESNTYAFDGGEDLPGPMPTVAWAWNTDTNARVLLIGDGDFVTNGQIFATRGNAILFTDGLAWLTGFSERVTFPTGIGITGLPVLTIDAPTLDSIRLLTIVIMPGIVFIAGVIVWLRRLRA